MAVTATRPADADAPVAAGAVDGAVLGRPRGLAEVLGTSDHGTVGRLFAGTSLFLLIGVLVVAVLVGVERIDGEAGLFPGEYGQLLSLREIGAPFLFAIPFLLGLAIAVVPLQVGARTIAFPRAATGAYWGWALSAVLFLAAYVINGGPGGGRLDGRVLWVLALGGMLVALTLAAVCVATTVLALRTPGLSLDRVPMFAWSSLVASVLWLLSLPVVLGVVVLTYLDTQYFSGLYDGVGNLSGLRWATGQPQVALLAVPVLGIALDVVATSAGVRLRNRGIAQGAVAAVGVLSLGGFAFDQVNHPGIVTDVLYVAVGVALVLPVLAVLGGVADTLRRGSLSLTGPLVGAVASVLLVLAGAAVGAVRVVEPFALVGTSADTAYSALFVLAALAGGATGVAHWASKLQGASLPAGAAKGLPVLVLLGALLAAAPDLASGFLDQSVTGVGAQRDGVEALNVVSVAGYALVLLAALGLAGAIGAASRNASKGGGELADDPWGGGQTLEWATTSPPPPGNFGALEAVRSPEPLLDRRDEAGTTTGGDA